MKTYHCDNIRQVFYLARRLLFLTLILGCALPLPARADNTTEFFDSFATNGDDSGWIFPAYYPNARFSFTNGGYRLQSIATPPAVAAAFRPDLVYSNFQLSLDIIDWNRYPWPSNFAAISLAARVEGFEAVNTLTGYVFWFLPNGNTNNDGNGQIGIFRGDPDNMSTVQTNLLLPINLTHQYRLVFTGVGSVMTGQLFDLTNLAEAVATVQMTDGTYASGVVGIFADDDAAAVGIGNKPVDFTVKNFYAGPPTPALNIQTAIILSWPDNYAGYSLESATSLNGPWQSSEVSIEDSDGFYSATVATTNSSEFFRLLYQP